jgi:hypothetical protein
MSLWTSAHRVS